MLLEQAMLRLAQTMQGRVVPSSFGLYQRSRLLVKGKSDLNEAKDDVRGNSESFGEFKIFVARTPRIYP
jgi:hypothetical protein